MKISIFIFLVLVANALAVDRYTNLNGEAIYPCRDWDRVTNSDGSFFWGCVWSPSQSLNIVREDVLEDEFDKTLAIIAKLERRVKALEDALRKSSPLPSQKK